jgi:hypothetical protein
MRLCTCKVGDHPLLGIVIDKQVIIPALDKKAAQNAVLVSTSELISSGTTG